MLKPPNHLLRALLDQNQYLIYFSIYLHLPPPLFPEFPKGVKYYVDFTPAHHKVGPRVYSSELTEESIDIKNYKNLILARFFSQAPFNFFQKGLLYCEI